MRKDIEKVVTEGGKRGDKDSYGRHRSQLKSSKLEELPAKESIAKWRGWGRDSAKNINPLKRFLLSRIGHIWDDVRSEITTAIHKYDIREDALRYVLTTTYMGVDGEVYYDDELSGRYRWGQKENSNHISTTWRIVYVCPKTGTLQAVPQKKYVKKEKPITQCPVDDTHSCHKIDGIWYLVTFDKVPDPVYCKYTTAQQRDNGGKKGYWKYTSVRDAFLGWCHRGEWKVNGKTGYYASKKKQLSHKELKKFNLQNDPAI